MTDATTTGPVEHTGRGPLTTDELAARIARDIPDGSYVNLGIGRPTRIAEHLPAEAGIVLHTENGMLGMRPRRVTRWTRTSPTPARRR